MARKSLSSGMSALRFGGSWNRIGPSLVRRSAARDQNSSTESRAPLSRRTWVMYRLALTTKANPAGVSSRHRSNVDSFGSM